MNIQLTDKVVFDTVVQLHKDSSILKRMDDKAYKTAVARMNDEADRRTAPALLEGFD